MKYILTNASVNNVIVLQYLLLGDYLIEVNIYVTLGSSSESV